MSGLSTRTLVAVLDVLAENGHHQTLCDLHRQSDNPKAYSLVKPETRKLLQ